MPILDYFSLANRAHLAFGNFTLNRISQAIKTIDKAHCEPGDFIPHFLALCKRPERVGRMLRGMHEVGLIGLLIPDFQIVNCHAQHNIYHIYTTDEHTISVVRQLAYLKDSKDPVLDSCRTALTQVGNMDVLILACIFHDIGKGIPGDHSITGAKMVKLSAGAKIAKLVSNTPTAYFDPSRKCYVMTSDSFRDGR